MITLSLNYCFGYVPVFKGSYSPVNFEIQRKGLVDTS